MSQEAILFGIVLGAIVLLHRESPLVEGLGDTPADDDEGLVGEASREGSEPPAETRGDGGSIRVGCVGTQHSHLEIVQR